MTDRLIDLNASRAARAEAREEPVVIVVGDDRYELPAEMPASVIDAFAGAGAGANTFEQLGSLRGALLAMLGEDVYNALVTKHRLSLEELEIVLDEVTSRYGVSMGESSASASSSSATTAPSRPTSAATSEPTSEQRSTVPATP